MKTKEEQITEAVLSMKSDLDKAKELIRNLIDVMERAGCKRYPGSVIDRAEEFLSKD